jgi:pimeloyl-ACP methyl ester carboxylesterase
MRGVRSGGRAAFTAGLVLVLAVLTASAGRRSSPVSPDRRSATAGAVSTTIAWRACTDDEMADVGEPFRSQMQCAFLNVPVDYEHPQGRTLRLFVSRRPSTAPDPLGPLFVNQGGPGKEAARYAVSIAAFPAFDRFDIVGMDPRGTGRSTHLHCRESLAKLPAVSAGTDGEYRTFVHAADAFSRSCAEDPNLPFFGSNNVARDMDRIRELLGAEQISYFGKSYGSDLGTAYAVQFPNRVRAAVLDGATDLTLDPVDFVIQQARAGRRAFDAYLAHCLAGECAWTRGEDPATAWAQLVRHRNSDPLKDPESGSRITGDTLLDFAHDSGGAPYGDIDAALDALVLHKDASAFVPSQLDAEAERDAVAFFAITCLDLPVHRFHPALARLRDAVGDPPSGSIQVLALCAAWPKPGDPVVVRRLPAGSRVMVVSTRGDVPTPYESGVGLARALDVPLLTWEANAHTAYLFSPCVAQYANRLLVDLQTISPDGASCPNDNVASDSAPESDEPDLPAT